MATHNVTAASSIAGVSAMDHNRGIYDTMASSFAANTGVDSARASIDLINTSATFNSTSTCIAAFDLAVTSIADFVGAFSPQGVYNTAIAGALLALFESSVYDLTPDVLVMNNTTGSLFRYEGFDFSQYIQIGQFTYGAKSDGLYLLGSGDTDDGAEIEASIDLGNLDFGTALEKWLHYMYIGVKGGAMYIRVVDRFGNPYYYRAEPSDTLDVVRVQFGRGLRSNHY